ncbi:unnamed protein product [Brassica rapa]|uniref:Uncharacterized protein n=1 Tax=Brassica campestris TaxID=3711 RepID=A0A8D9DGT7_BRACM|nr:unnamed protein product [Brassica rapa]
MQPELRSLDSDRDPPSSSTAALLTTTTRHLSTVASPKTMTKKIDRNTDGLLKLNMISFTIPILFSHKLGINRYGSTVSVAADNLAAHASGSDENGAVEKTAFDVKLEKFEAASGTTISAMFEQQPAFKSARKILESAIELMLNRECSFREQGGVVAHRIHRTHL